VYPIILVFIFSPPGIYLPALKHSLHYTESDFYNSNHFLDFLAYGILKKKRFHKICFFFVLYYNIYSIYRI